MEKVIVKTAFAKVCPECYDRYSLNENFCGECGVALETDYLIKTN